MTTVDAHAEHTGAHDEHTGASAVRTSSPTRAGQALGAIAAWVTTTDHKRIGRMFVGCGLLGGLGAAVLGALLAIERVDADGYALLDTKSAPLVATLFRVLLPFGMVAPLALGLAVAVVPLQLGARSIAFPRLAAMGFWMWAVGIVLVVISHLDDGGPAGGKAKAVSLFLAAMALAAFGLVLAALSVAATVMTTRAPGMTLARAPMFSFAALVGSVGMLLTLPVLIGDLTYLWADQRYSLAGAYAQGGSLEWMGWALGFPMVLVLATVAVGVFAEVVPVATRSRQPMRFVVLTGLSLLGVAALSAVTQLPQVLVWDGSAANRVKDVLRYAFFMGLPILGLLTVLGGAGLALRAQRPRLSAPLVFSFLGLTMVLTGAAAALVDGVAKADLANTVFEEAVVVYVVDGALLSLMGAVAFWGPKLWGRRLADGPAIGLAALGFVATVLAALPYVFAGFADQPALVAGSFDYSGPKELWNVAVAAGHGLMALVVVAFAMLALKAFTRGDAAGDDPWDAGTLEWATSSPAPADNFAEVAVVSSPEPLTDLKPAGAQVGGP